MPVCECGKLKNTAGDRLPFVLGLLPALALACLFVGNWATRGGGAVEQLELLPGTLLVDIEPDQPVRILGEVEGVGSGLTSIVDSLTDLQSLAGKPNGHQTSCYRKVCRKCWNACNEGMNICLATAGTAPPPGYCTKVWDKMADCSKSIHHFDIGGGPNNGFRDNQYHFMVAAWSQCAHGHTASGRPW
jgi:hypothetical protein